MRDDIKLHKALLESNSNMVIDPLNSISFNELMEASYKLVAHQTNINSESAIYGIYKPLFPKSGRMLRYRFERPKFSTKIKINQDNTDVEELFIFIKDQQFMDANVRSEDINLVYLNNETKKSDYKEESFITTFTYESLNCEHVLVDIVSEDLTNLQIHRYSEQNQLPKKIKYIRVYSENR